MKKNFFRFLVLLLDGILLNNCSDSAVNEFYSASLNNQLLSVSSNTVSFSALGESKSIMVNSRETSWRFIDYPNWLTIDPIRGDGSTKVTLTADENGSADSIRSGFFYIISDDKHWNYRINISATQEKADAFIRPDKNNLTFSASTASKEIKIDSNTKWEPKNNETWLTISPKESILTISVSENTTGKDRTSTIQLIGSNISSKIDVTQHAGNISCSVDHIYFEQSGGEQVFTMKSETSWNATPSMDWIQISPTNGTAGSHNLKVTTKENSMTSERNGHIYFSMDGNTMSQLPVTQKGIYLETDVISLDFSPNSENKTISISSNIKWFVNCSSNWISLSGKNGFGNGILTVSVQENDTSDSRTSNIQVTSEDKSLSKDIQVTQARKTISVDCSDLTFSNEGGKKELKIDCNASWKAVSSVSWLSLSQTSGKGNAALSVKASANTEKTSRTGNITFTCGGMNKMVYIKQEAEMFFILSQNEFNFPPSSGSKQLDIKSNQSWNANINVDWISLSATSGENDATLKISVKENTSTSPRTGIITFIPNIGSFYRVSVTQEKADIFISVSPNSLSFTAAGGSKTLKVKSNDFWNTSSNVSWLSISPSSGTGDATLEITANANTSTSKRNGKITFIAENATSIVSVVQEGRTYPGGHDYVDLGLPSGTLWATCNVGASSPEEYGNYYAWGETTPKGAYLWSNLNYCNNAYGNSFYKYNTNSRYGTVDNKKTLEASDDAANVNWGNGWIMPTDSEWTELRENCSWVWTSQNGVNGFKAISKKNGSALFFPAAGYYSGTTCANKGDCGFYWSSSLNVDSPQYAWSVPMGSTMVSLPPSVGRVSHVRCEGISIRPVYHPQ